MLMILFSMKTESVTKPSSIETATQQQHEHEHEHERNNAQQFSGQQTKTQ